MNRHPMSFGLVFGVLGMVVLLSPPSAHAQTPILIEGRIEDAVTAQPLTGIFATSADSSVATISDEDGRFTLSLPPDSGRVVLVYGLGYDVQRFELPDESAERTVVLRVEPLPIVIQGVTASAEQAIEVLQRNITSRRNGYGFGPVRGYSRDFIDRYVMPGTTALDFIHQRVPRAQPCVRGDGLCRPGRVRTISNPNPQTPYMVCLDERPATIDELSTLPIESVVTIEMIDRARINIYSRMWVLDRVRRDRLQMKSLVMGC